MKNVKKYKNVLAVICAMLLCSLAVMGCGQNSGAAGSSEAPAEAQEAEAPETEAQDAETQEAEAPAAETQEAEAPAAEETAEVSEVQGEAQEGSQAAVNAAPGEIAPRDIDKTENALGAAASQKPSAEDYRVFASEMMGFSFLYLKDHTAYMNSSGAALLAIDGDTARTGLFVSVTDAEYMPTKEEYFETEIFNLQQRYLNAMAIQPQLDTINVGGHELYGIIYAYSNPSGEAIDCTEFIEERDDKYIFYHTRAPRKTSGPELNALGAAMVSLVFDANAYGKPEIEEGGLPIDEFDTEYGLDSNGVNTQQNSISASGSAPESEFESGFYFDTDSSYLIISDEDVTQVYTGGVMEGANFSVERVELSESIGDTVVNRKNEVAQMLSVRMIGQPEVQLLEIGDRRLAGFTTTYSSVDGTRTIIAEEYYEEIGGSTYCWYAIYDKGDEVTPDAFGHAMETFVLK